MSNYALMKWRLSQNVYPNFYFKYFKYHVLYLCVSVYGCLLLYILCSTFYFRVQMLDLFWVQSSCWETNEESRIEFKSHSHVSVKFRNLVSGV